MVPVPRFAVWYGLAISGPLALLLALDKALKLAASTTVLYDAQHGKIGKLLWYTLAQPSVASTFCTLLGGILVIGALLSVISGRRGHRWIGWVASIALVYAAAIAGACLHHEPRPLWPEVASTALSDFCALAALWWRDAATLLLLTVIAALHAWRSSRGRSVIRSAVLWTVVVVCYSIVILDIGFFITTGAALSTEDVSYGLSSPFEAWTLGRGSISPVAARVIGGIVLAGIGCLAAAILITRRSRRPPSARIESRAAPLGLLVWPALAFALVSPAAPHDIWESPPADDPLLNLSVDGLETDLLRAIVLHGSGTPSRLVPALYDEPIEVARTPRTRPLNVVILVLESARARDTTVYSPGLDTTPFLAQLARDSLVVDHMYAVIPRTTAAWISIFAGRYSSTGAIVRRWANNGTPTFESSMPRLLRPLGYTSAFFLPTTLHFESDGAVVRALGFDEVVTQESIPEPASGLVTPFGWEDRALLAPIGRWLDARRGDGHPFLLAVMTNVGHYPYGLPRGYHMQDFPSLNKAHERYLNCMHYIDGYLRDLVQELRDRGMLDNTLLVVLGDHGEALGEHGSFFRGRGLNEELLQIPMLVRLPADMRRSGHIGGLRQQIDVLPTVMDSLGLALSGSLPGRSLLSDTGHDALFFSQHLDYTDLAMRVGRYKYIYDFGRGPPQVFDLDRDPDERVNIEGQLGLRNSMQARVDLLAWRDRVARTYDPRSTIQPMPSDGGGSLQARLNPARP